VIAATVSEAPYVLDGLMDHVHETDLRCRIPPCASEPRREATNSLRRAVFFHRQGEIRDRTLESQSFRACGLSLMTAAIVHWNTVYLDRAFRQLRAQADLVPDNLLAHVGSTVR
jgi:TnpA family transposase